MVQKPKDVDFVNGGHAFTQVPRRHKLKQHSRLEIISYPIESVKPRTFILPIRFVCPTVTMKSRIILVCQSDGLCIMLAAATASSTSLEVDHQRTFVRQRGKQKDVKEQMQMIKLQNILHKDTCKRILAGWFCRQLIVDITSNPSTMELNWRHPECSLEGRPDLTRLQMKRLCELFEEALDIKLSLTPRSQFSRRSSPENGSRSWLERIELVAADPLLRWSKKVKTE